MEYELEKGICCLDQFLIFELLSKSSEEIK
jgi:hypothetical protein